MNACDTNPLDDVGQRALSDNMFVICAPFTILFNATVLVIAFKYVNLTERLDQWFVVHMSAVNLIFGTVYMVVRPYSATLPGWLCRPYYLVIYTCTATSVLFLLLLNIHKFITLFMPYRSETLISKGKVFAQIIIVWLLVITYSTISASKLIFVDSDPCYQCRVYPDPYLYASMMLIFFLFPLILSLIISICIFALAQSKTKRPADGSVIDADDKTLKRICFVFSYTVFTAITFLPFRIGMSIDVLCKLSRRSISSDRFHVNHEAHQHCVDERILFSLLCLLPFGSVINPLITIVTQKFYRIGVQKFLFNLRDCFHCKTGEKLLFKKDGTITAI